MAPPRYKKPFNRKTNNKTKVSDGEFDLEKARHEVFMVGIKGLSFKDKREAKRELAIRLGAIPKKKRGKNIKQHIEEVRERKLKEESDRKERAEMGIFDKKKSSANKNPKRKKGLNEVHDMDYQIGKFRNGVQYLSKEDIERMKRRK